MGVLRRKPHARSAGQNMEDGRMFTLRLSRPAAAVALAALLMAVAWSFFMGVMVGRGQNPEARVEELTGFKADAAASPEDAPAQSPSAAHAPEAPPAAPSGPQAAATAAPAAPEDRGEAAPPAQAPGKPAYPFGRPKGEGLTAWGIQPEARPQAGPAAAQEAGRKPSGETPAAKTAPSRPQFDYTYQVAAFKKADEADKLRARLEARGIRARTRRSGRVTLVTAHLRGTDEAAAALGETLKGMRLDTPVLLSRKAVAPSSGKRKGR